MVPHSLVFYSIKLLRVLGPLPLQTPPRTAPYSDTSTPHSCRLPSSPGSSQALGLRLSVPHADREASPQPRPHPTPRGSGLSPTTEATPARQPRSFIVDSKLPKWRRLLPPRKPPPAPNRPLSAASSAPALALLERPRPRAARARRSTRRPASPPSLPAFRALPKSPPGLS